MLHMAICANLLNAIGGTPQINHANFVPTYPGPLPLGIADGLTVSLEKFSLGLVQNVFMEIEEPAHPRDGENLTDDPLDNVVTLGDF